MPWHYAPRLRAIEEYRESSGIYQTLDSGGVTVIKAQESANQRVKVVPVAFVNVYEGVQYTAS